LGTAEGKLMAHISRCRCLIHIVPSLSVSSLQSGSMAVDESLLGLLQTFDTLLALNTHGDIQTDALLAHVEYMRHQQDQTYRASGTCPTGNACPTAPPRFIGVPRVALDLCNVFVIAEEYEARWRSVTDLLVAPSVFMATHPASVQSGKRLEVVYPALSYQALSAAETGGGLSWPRRPGGPLRVGYFGRLSSERSPGLFVRAVAYLFERYPADFLNRHFEFVVSGAGPGLNYTMALAEALGVRGIVHFTGYAADLISAICEADLVVNPMARGENFGIMQLESMACGTPLLAFNRSASQESVHPMGSRLLQEVSVRALGEAILAGLIAPQGWGWSAETLARSAADVKKRFSPSAHVLRMLKALQ
jgi:glycosyltransferase involved in cell wall biosynthesis